MEARLEEILLALAVGSAVAIGAKRFALPFNVALVVVGLLLVLFDVLPRTALDPEVVLQLFLPVLVFEGALSADAEAMKVARRPILALAIPGVLVSLLATAAVATYALSLPFSAALLLGALLSITDTVSVLVAFRSVPVPRRLAAIMEGESLFNDGTALVLVALAAQVVLVGRMEASVLFGALAIAIVGGVAVGAVLGIVGSQVLPRSPDHLTVILASMVVVFATSLIAEKAHASPVIAVVVLGLMLGRAARRSLPATSVVALQTFWETVGFMVNVFLFLLVGMQIDARSLFHEAGSIALAVLATHAGRAVTVYGSFGALKATTGEGAPTSWQHVMVFGNIKGALGMAAVLTLPAHMPHRDRLVAIVFGVTFVSLVTQGSAFRRALRWLGVAQAHADPSVAAAKATLVAARRGQAELDTLFAEGFLPRQEHAERRAQFQRQVIEAERALAAPGGTPEREALVDRALLIAQKAALLDALRRGLLDEAAAASRIDAIDRLLLEGGSH